MSGARIFINYRRADSAGWAGRLHADLVDRFGADRVFRDVTTTYGIDFHENIERVMDESAVCLVIIGPRWATITDDHGSRRLHKPDDLVRIEIERALQRRDVRVIPVLVDGAKMPAAADLPESLRQLVRHHAGELSDSRWDYDVGRLGDHLAGIVSAPPGKRRQEHGDGAERAGFAAVATLCAAALAGLAAASVSAPLAGQGDTDVERLVAYATERGIIWAVIGAVAAAGAAVAFGRSRAPVGRALVGAGAGLLGGAAGGALLIAAKRFAEVDAAYLLALAALALPGVLLAGSLARTARVSRAECMLAAVAGAALAAVFSGGERPIRLALHAAIVVGAVCVVIASQPHRHALGARPQGRHAPAGS